MRTALITGANKIISLEMARKLADENYFVYIGCSDLAIGEQVVKELAADGIGTVDIFYVDISSESSIDAAGQEIGILINSLDVLINNTIDTFFMSTYGLSTHPDSGKGIFEVNDAGTKGIVNKLTELLRKSLSPRIVNVIWTSSTRTGTNQSAQTFFHHRLLDLQPAIELMRLQTAHVVNKPRKTNFKIDTIVTSVTGIDPHDHQVIQKVKNESIDIIKYALTGKKDLGSIAVSLDIGGDDSTCAAV